MAIDHIECITMNGHGQTVDLEENNAQNVVR